MIPNNLRIGDYHLRPSTDYPDGSKAIWIEAPDGEGGQFPAKDLEKVIKEYYDKNF